MNASEDDRGQSAYSAYYDMYVVFKVILGLCFLLAIAADIYLIVIISKFKTIQTNANLLFRSVAWCHLCYSLLGTTLYITVTLLSYGVHHVGVFFLKNVDYICLGVVYLILTFIAVDWAVSQYRTNYYENHPRLFKSGVPICLLLALPETLVTSFASFTVDLPALTFLQFMCKAVSYFVCFVVLLVLFVVRKCNPPPTVDPKAEYRLTVPCVYFLMVLPSTITSSATLSFSTHLEDIVFEDGSIVGDITSGIFVLAPVVMVLLLSRTSKYFRTAFIRCCKRKTVEGYADDNLDDAEPVDGEQNPPVAFRKSFEGVNI
ncbi:hypothetical protein GWI33_007549 [Rhynchophorus ferrugineus]|uniref:Uncharacterized protein n=1 Tax=Rhynchophorus ferrugineus TaxID=354439 RepID=A0A834MGJ5_RHYFE|nr:hypothetical protein GWI33_007549 [Rhynchophorus ferrugineus]